MKHFVRNLIQKHPVILLYLMFGILTTFVNIVSYVFFTKSLGLNYKTATTLSWIFAVAFAFMTNKRYVFNSSTHHPALVIKELGSFIIFRLASYGLDIVTMILFIEVFRVNDLVSKMIANGLVIVFNYVASKFIIFKTTKQPQEEIQ